MTLRGCNLEVPTQNSHTPCLINDQRLVTSQFPSLAHPMSLVHCEFFSPAFASKEDAKTFLSSISPPRDLVCPITLELFQDPVVAVGDGNTYERNAIQTYFESQMMNTGMIRSPVTNAYFEGGGGEGGGGSDGGRELLMALAENKAIAALARQYREKLGTELCARCNAVLKYNGEPEVLGDGGIRIRGLVEAGADLGLRLCDGGNTAFMTVSIFG